MRKPRVSTLIIIGQSILLLICLGALAVAMWHNYFLKYYAKRYAAEAGYAEALRHYTRGELWIYETKPYKQDYDGTGPVRNDGDIEPAGKLDGRLSVYYYLVFEDFPGPHREIQQAFVDGYNWQMRLYTEHPDWFDQCGLRIPMRDLKGKKQPSAIK
jgi:hypothetical protein